MLAVLESTCNGGELGWILGEQPWLWLTKVLLVPPRDPWPRLWNNQRRGFPLESPSQILHRAPGMLGLDLGMLGSELQVASPADVKRGNVPCGCVSVLLI